MFLPIVYAALVVLVFFIWVRPSLLGAAWVRATAWARFWETKMIQSKDGYAAVKDMKKEQLQGRAAELQDKYASVMAKNRTIKTQLENKERREAELNRTREIVVSKAEKAAPDSEEFNRLALDLKKIDDHIAKLDAEEEVLAQALNELVKEMEEIKPYLDELDDKIVKADMDKELGLVKLELAEVKKDRARSKGLAVGGKETMVDKYDKQVDEYLQKEIAAGDIAAERAGGTEDEIVKRYQKESVGSTAAESLRAELAKRRGETPAPATATPAQPETLTK